MTENNPKITSESVIVLNIKHQAHIKPKVVYDKREKKFKEEEQECVEKRILGKEFIENCLATSCIDSIPKGLWKQLTVKDRINKHIRDIVRDVTKKGYVDHHDYSWDLN